MYLFPFLPFRFHQPQGSEKQASHLGVVHTSKLHFWEPVVIQEDHCPLYRHVPAPSVVVFRMLAFRKHRMCFVLTGNLRSSHPISPKEFFLAPSASLRSPHWRFAHLGLTSNTIHCFLKPWLTDIGFLVPRSLCNRQLY